jgi:alpha-galactosidase/6-phospho-beta-glucosidase family protein
LLSQQRQGHKLKVRGPDHSAAQLQQKTHIGRCLIARQKGSGPCEIFNGPNRVAVPDLPRDAIVEIPAMTTQEGMAPIPVGEIPANLAAVLLRRIAVVEAAAETALSGSRKMMVEAMIMDGAVKGGSTAEKLTDAMLRARAEHLVPSPD